MSKHEAVKSFFEPKVRELAGELMFNFSPERESISMVTDYSGRVANSYVTGRKRKVYGLSFIITRAYSSEEDDLNLEAMEFAQAFMDWVHAQNMARNFPNLGEGCVVEKIEVLQNMPNLAGVNAQEGLARYIIQCRIFYLDDNEKVF